MYNKEYLEAGTKITTEDILNFEKNTTLKIERGDVVLIRTGRWSEKSIIGDWDSSKLSSGD